MNNQAKIGIALASALVIGAVGYWGFNQINTPDADQSTQMETIVAEKFGVLESVRAVKAHPGYAELEALAKEMNDLKRDTQMKMQRTAAMSMPAGLRMEISNNMMAGEQAARTEANQKLEAKETELNKRLAEVELAKRRAASEEMENYRRSVSEEYKLKIFNIKLKLETLHVADEAKESMEADMQKLQAEEEAKLGEKYQEILTKLSEEMMVEQKKATEEMDAYIEEVGKEYGLLGAKGVAPNEAAMAELAQMNQQLQADVESAQAEYEAKRKQHDEIEGMILRDIKLKVARIAGEQGLTVVFGDVRVNLNAIDITDEVIDACKESWKK